jgi:Ni/Co efflux regulator RcnB
MKALLISIAAAAVILAAPAAYAAGNDHPKGNHASSYPSGKSSQGSTSHTGGNSGNTATGQTGNSNASGGTSTGGTKHHQHQSSGMGAGSTTSGNQQNNNWNNPSGHKQRSGNAWRRGTMHGAANLRFFHRNLRASHRFHIGRYRGPRGYHYRHWVFGDFLPSIYFGEDYWIDNYDDYGLEDPPDGYVWVRYGPDALLIDEDSGEIVEVEYDVFY